MPKVVMGLTDKDIEHAETISAFTRSANKAHTVSIALSLTAFLTRAVAAGGQIILKTENGEIERVLMDEIENAR